MSFVKIDRDGTEPETPNVGEPCKRGHQDGVYFKYDADNFYCVTCHAGMGNDFYHAHKPAHAKDDRA